MWYGGFAWFAVPAVIPNPALPSTCLTVQVGQQHAGWVAFFQNHVLAALECVWFNRGEAKNRHVVAEKLAAHARDPK